MKILLVGTHQTIEPYISSLKNNHVCAEIQTLLVNNSGENNLDDIQYKTSISELDMSTVDIIILCTEYSTIADSIDQLFSSSAGVIWDSQFVNEQIDLQTIREKVKEHQIKLLMANDSLFSHQMANVYENIENGRIGPLGVVNMKLHRPISSVQSHKHALQAELATLYPYLHAIDHVFAMNRKYEENNYTTMILKLDTSSIINVEVYTGIVDYHRSGEFTGQKGVLHYGSEQETMVFRKKDQPLEKWTPTKLSTSLDMIDFVTSTTFDKDDVDQYLYLHEQLLIVKDAVLQSIQANAPVNLKEGANHE